jgi:cyclopropane fatty-acyl-phospholipid synthase-like methyltransferase
MNPNKALWEKGDFTRIADTMRQSGEALVNSLGITKGMKVLDVGCGDGTTAEFVDEFRNYYGPTMNAFAAAEQNGRADGLRRELVTLFTEKNTREDGTCSIPATFMQVTVSV